MVRPRRGFDRKKSYILVVVMDSVTLLLQVRSRGTSQGAIDITCAASEGFMKDFLLIEYQKQ